MLKLWYEREMDQKLNIHTQSIREWEDIEKAKSYNRTEATPYQALDRFFEFYELPERAKFVDIGCGSGRMLFYVHHRFDIPVTGIELNPQTFYDLEQNKVHYLENAQSTSSQIILQNIYAEEYIFQAEDNVIYFFNPFTIRIFAKVIQNLEQSIFEHTRNVDIILYYPLYEIQQFMETKTIFERVGSVSLQNIYEDEFEKFIVYRYEAPQE